MQTAQEVANKRRDISCQLELLQAIVRPLAPKSGRVSVLLGILSIWGVSGLLAAPAGYYSMLLPISRWRTCEHKPTTDIVLCKSTTLYFFFILSL